MRKQVAGWSGWRGVALLTAVLAAGLSPAWADAVGAPADLPPAAGEPPEPVLMQPASLDRHLVALDAGLGAGRVEGVGVAGTLVGLSLQPLERHRLRLRQAVFSNDHGPAGDNADGASFGLGDFFACLFGACPDEDYAGGPTGGNRYDDYRETAVLYQYRAAHKTLSPGRRGEVWMGLGPVRVRRETWRYQVNNGEVADFVAATDSHGVGYEVDLVMRGRHWFLQGVLYGASAGASEGLGLNAALGVGLGF